METRLNKIYRKLEELKMRYKVRKDGLEIVKQPKEKQLR